MPAPARLLLVRHGQIAANLTKVWHGSTDSPLTAEGERQAARVATHLAATRPDIVAVYTSPLGRARRTAEAIAAPLGLVPAVHPALAEYAIGALEGEAYLDLVTRHGFFERTGADLDWAPPGGESLRAVAGRVVEALQAIAACHPGAVVTAVSHGAALAAGLSSLLHGDPRGWERYHKRNTGVTELVLDPEPVLVSFDSLVHLDDG